MGYFLLKTVITALIVAGISELSRRFSLMAALLASLPLTTLLAFIWIYLDTGDTKKIAGMSNDVFWLVIPSLSFFLILPWLLGQNMPFWSALLLSCVATIAVYGLGFLLYSQFVK
jgi:hypothetical protein